MNRTPRLVRILEFAAVLLVVSASGAHSEHDGTPPNYPQSIEHSLAALLSQREASGENVDLLLKLSEVYKDLGDDLYTDDEKRRGAYEEGARLAQRAIELQEAHAHAHFLYAANLGNDKRLKGRGSAMLALKDIKSHLARAIALDPQHARALQFMGGLLAELPWFLGGDRDAARDYLERAVAADGNYTNARILLAKLYIKRDRVDDARAQLEAVIHAESPHYSHAWTNRLKPEAERLLQSLANDPSH